MKPFYLFSPVTLFGATARKVIQATALLFLVAVVALGGLSSCQRTSQAYFAPTHHPAPQRIAATKPAADPSITASLDDDVPVSAKPGWLQTESTGAEPVSDVTRRMPVLQQHGKRAARKAVPPACDQIVLRNGDVIEAKIKEVGVQEIKYKKCDRPDGPDYTISKRDVLSIKYSTGDVERFNAAPATSNNSSGSRASYDSPTNGQSDGPRTDPFAIVAVATGGLAILTGYGAFLLGAAAIVFGALSLSRIRKEPGRFKGRGLAIGGMVAGLVSAGLILLYILL